MTTLTTPPPPPGTTVRIGPWYVPGCGIRPEIHDETGHVICRMADTGDAMEAAATLIAAAPDLLAALILCEQRLAKNKSEHDPGTTHPQLDAARAAIAKARGQ